MKHGNKHFNEGKSKEECNLLSTNILDAISAPLIVIKI